MRLLAAYRFEGDALALCAQEISKLRRIIVLAEKLICESSKPKRGRQTSQNGNG
jgi:hypothetical protein